MTRAWVWRGLLLSGWLLTVSPVRAEHEAEASAHELSPYEVESIQIAFDREELEPEPEPDGMIIEAIDFVQLDVLEKRDPVPAFVRKAGNALHVTTKEHFIRRELLFGVGDVYDQLRIDETERNLRRFGLQFSLVLVVAAKGSGPGLVRIVVITKDVWSLRLNSEVTGYGVRANSLVLQPAETNLMGMGRTLYGSTILDPYTYWLGAGFVDPRIGDSQIAVRTEGRVAMRCETNKPEGGLGYFAYGKPLYTTRTPWAWQVAMLYEQAIQRLQLNAPLCSQPGVQFTEVEDPPNSDNVIGTVPSNIHIERLQGQLAFVRSFGVPTKNDIGFGMEVDRVIQRTEDLSGYDPEAAAAFKQQYLGQSDQRISPYVQYHAYTTRFLRLLNVETLGFQEDFRLGHEAFLRLYPAAQELGSTRNLLGVFASMAYTAPLGRGFARPWTAVEMQWSTPQGSDGEVRTGLRIVSPPFKVARLVLDGAFRYRFDNYFNPVVQLNGAGRLRGYDFRGFNGINYLVYNIELRSRDLALFSLLFGATAFYDIGDAFDSFSEFHPKHSVGGGLRVVFPQGQREVFRVDFGYPLSHGPGIDQHRSPRVVFSFGQAFGVPRPAPDALITQ